MSVTGLCQICERREAVDGCDRCGRLVCAHHHDEQTGFCAECEAEISGGGDRTGGEEQDYPDGVGEYRF